MASEYKSQFAVSADIMLLNFLSMNKKYKQCVWHIGAADDLQRQSTGNFLLNMHAGG